MKTRRDTLRGLGLTALAFAAGPARAETFQEALAAAMPPIARESGGRLGVAVLDRASGRRFGYQADNRFPLCSTFKLVAAAAVLKHVEDGSEQLTRRIRITAAEVVAGSTKINAPIEGDGPTLAELCELAITYSDNTSGNMLLNAIGGPAGLTAYARTLGDTMTRLDRNEPTLNEALPGDPRDTTTPNAMLATMDALLFGNALNAASKQQLTQWLIDNKTGGTRLRAGLPQGWRAGDKTGTGERGTANDVGVLWTPQNTPVLVTVYLTESTAGADARNKTSADVARAVVAVLT